MTDVEHIEVNAPRRISIDAVCVLVLAMLLTAGCSSLSDQRLASMSPGVTPIPTPTPEASATRAAAGIEGIAEADPQCPVVEPGAACPPAPVSRTIAVLVGDQEVTRFTSADDGTFRVLLPPGDYTLREVVAPGIPASLKPVTVSVPAAGFVHVVLLFDTGIR